MSGAVFPLAGQQADAVDPDYSVWLSASAGTGKTQVLSARVLRLLLQPGTSPESLLCLTFTKAGAAEMAMRVNDVLARWVMLDDAALARELGHIGAPVDPETRHRARTLFTRVLDCPGGGLRIDTIHAFSQYLLAAFPEEAGLLPGTRAMEDRDRTLLSRDVLSKVVQTLDETGEAALADLSVRLGPDGAVAWLMRCADAQDAWRGPAAWQPPMRGRLLQLFGLPADMDESDLVRLCDDAAFDMGALRICRDANAAWGTKNGLETAGFIDAFSSATASERLALRSGFSGTLFTLKGDPKNAKSLEKFEPSFVDMAMRVRDALADIDKRARLLALADWLAPALELGRTFALAWEEAKARQGFIDFDDQIRRAAKLLSTGAPAEWIRFKLDRQFDHILVDEAQDTNAAQWSIIEALTGDFFTGLGQRDDILRTIFVVGDYKQAIFRFQGTSPERFASAKRAYRERIADAVAAARDFARETRAAEPPVRLRELRDLDLDRSFRTTQPVLDFVDEAIAAIGATNFGLERAPPRHVGADGPGRVTLWEPLGAQDGEQADDDAGDDWLPGPERRMADRIALEIRDWLDRGYPLHKGGSRNAGPGDIMVLVRKRKELAGLIVARLHAAGVPVAGVDRLRLGAPLAVKDLVAVLRFAANPQDDLNLANALVSPLLGWTQDDLLAHGYRKEGRTLWDQLKSADSELPRRAVEALRGLLARVDFEPPEALLHWMLTGPWQGRRKLVARLGKEANDPIDELLNAAFAYSSQHAASLPGFLQWFDAGDEELKRETEASGGLVRVMTVHGSKGLQSPIVVLADATGNPHSARASAIVIGESEDAEGVPLPPLTSDDRLGPIAEEQERRAKEEMEEHWRLLYVAMTRAEEALFVGGALGLREKEPNEDSWYARLAPLMDATGNFAGNVLPDPVNVDANSADTNAIQVPDWATRPVGPEPRPPRPLAPSSAGEDTGASPPLPPEQARNAARRGVLIHALLERLPEVEPTQREERADRWLARHAADLEPDERKEMTASAMTVLGDARFAPVFAPGSLAEVPLAAVVGGQVVAGTVDRLLITADAVTVVDYKTARRPPATRTDIPRSTLRQMAAYVAALETIYPDRTVRAGVLYTQTPILFELGPNDLAMHKAALQSSQESFQAVPVDESEADPN